MTRENKKIRQGRKRVILVNPPWFHENSNFTYDQGLSQNLGLSYIAAVLEKEGHSCEVVDALAAGVSQVRSFKIGDRKLYLIGLFPEEIVKLIPEDTDVIGITAPFTYMAPLVDDLIKQCRLSHPTTTLVVGGNYPSILPQRALKAGAHYVVIGEGEIPIRRLLSAQDPYSIQGISFCHEDQFFHNGFAEKINDLDSLPYPARHLFPMQQYLTWSQRGRKGQNTCSIITSRGCPRHCKFCSIHSIFGYDYRARSSRDILTEIAEVVEQYDVRHFEFEDDNLTLYPEKAMEIFRGLSQYEDVTWSTPNGLHLGTVTPRLLDEIKSSGCTQLCFGLESGDPKILAAMNKHLDLDQARRVIKWCSEREINTIGFFMTGYPGETRESFECTLQFALELKILGMKGFGISITKALPGTQLAAICKQQGYLAELNLNEMVLLGDYGGIVTPDFDLEEVKRRKYEFDQTLGMIYSSSCDQALLMENTHS